MPSFAEKDRNPQRLSAHSLRLGGEIFHNFSNWQLVLISKIIKHNAGRLHRLIAN